MPPIGSHQSTNSTKLMLLGESGAGKSGALASLVTAGYKLRILDFDNGLDTLKNYLTDPTSAYAKEILAKGIDLNEAVKFETITDHMKNQNGNLVPAKATVWNRTMNMLSEWKTPEDGSLGAPRSWGSDHVVVLDSLTMLSFGALYFVQALNGRLGNFAPGYDSQRDIGQAQTQLERLLQLLYDDDFKPNVIVISHITYRNPEGAPSMKDKDGKDIPDPFSKKGFPSSLGAALAPRIPRYFNNILQSEMSGSGTIARRKLHTIPQGNINLKSSAPMRTKPSYPIETGLAEFFKDVRGAQPNV